jgi:predicted DNA-binding WGR domain protein
MRWTHHARGVTLPGMDDALLLFRIDRPRNMARFYSLSVNATLFGGAALTRRWGRIGTRGREIVELHDDVRGATAARERWREIKSARGYRPA